MDSLTSALYTHSVTLTPCFLWTGQGLCFCRVLLLSSGGPRNSSDSIPVNLPNPVFLCVSDRRPWLAPTLAGSFLLLGTQLAGLPALHLAANYVVCRLACPSPDAPACLHQWVSMPVRQSSQSALLVHFTQPLIRFTYVSWSHNGITFFNP